jgi:hypothetical protein
MRPTLAADRRLFGKELLLALSPLVKGSGWQKSREFVVRRQDNVFLAGKVTVYLNVNRVVASLDAKPMSLDPILWEVLDLPENERLPLSFRATGAFTCQCLTLAATDLDCEDRSPSNVAVAFMEFIEAASPQAIDRLRNESFTEQLRQHPNQVQRGAYAVTLVVSLINDGQYQEAAQVARAYASGQLQSFQLTSLGKSFHEHALAWLAARTQ